MKPAMTRLVTLISSCIIMLTGCALPGQPTQAISYYVLTDPGPVQRSATVHPGTLLVREMDAPPFYQNTRFAFSRAPGTRSEYQFAQWSEPTSKRLSWMLRHRLDASGVFSVVTPLGSGVQGKYQLNARLIDFYHDGADAGPLSPGVALMVMEAELVNRTNAALLSRRVFVSQTQVASYDAAGAADALGRSANAVMDEVIAWLAATDVR